MDSAVWNNVVHSLSFTAQAQEAPPSPLGDHKLRPAFP